MNPRIQKLAEQSGLEFTYDPTETPMRVFVEVWGEDLEKFAELIVRECAKFTFKYTSDEKNIQEYNQVGWDFLSGDLRNAIEEHFGVNK